MVGPLDMIIKVCSSSFQMNQPVQQLYKSLTGNHQAVLKVQDPALTNSHQAAVMMPLVQQQHLLSQLHKLGWWRSCGSLNLNISNARSYKLIESVSSCRYLLLAPTWARITDTDDTRPGRDMPFATPTVPARATSNRRTDNWFTG